MSLVSEEAQERIVKSRRHYELVKLVIVSVTAVAVLFGLYTGNADRQIIKATSALIAECAIPPEERMPPVKVGDKDNDCYQRSLQQMATATETISSVSIVAAACGAANPGDVAKTRRCVEEALAR